MDRIAVIGAVGTAFNIISQIKDAISRFGYPAEIAGIIIDDKEAGSLIGDFPVIGSTGDLKMLCMDKNVKFIFSLFHMDKMKERLALLKSYNISDERFANFIHPLAYVSPDVKTGYGNVILSNSTIQAGVRIGNFNIINSNVTVEHDAEILEGNFISANACIGASTLIGRSVFIGLNSTIREHTQLTEDVFIGAHSLVINNMKSCRAWGSPAVVKFNKE
jgi:sugar O-acyltransferase (sialic acid O-acetyltransferase NeuD family)